MKIITIVLIVSVLATPTLSASTIPNYTTQLDVNSMINTIGGNVGCYLALAGLVSATVGLTFATGGLGAFAAAFIGTKIAAAGAAYTCAQADKAEAESN
jgi:hypothetical protein